MVTYVVTLMLCYAIFSIPANTINGVVFVCGDEPPRLPCLAIANVARDVTSHSGVTAADGNPAVTKTQRRAYASNGVTQPGAGASPSSVSNNVTGDGGGDDDDIRMCDVSDMLTNDNVAMTDEMTDIVW